MSERDEDLGVRAGPGRGSGRFRPLADVLAGGVPPMDWLVEDLIPTGALTVIAGPPKSMKSFLNLDLCLSTATGVEFARTFRTVRRGPVVLCMAEGGVQSLARRAWAILESIGGDA